MVKPRDPRPSQTTPVPHQFPPRNPPPGSRADTAGHSASTTPQVSSSLLTKLRRHRLDQILAANSIRKSLTGTSMVSSDDDAQQAAATESIPARPATRSSTAEEKRAHKRPSLGLDDEAAGLAAAGTFSSLVGQLPASKRPKRTKNTTGGAHAGCHIDNVTALEATDIDAGKGAHSSRPHALSGVVDVVTGNSIVATAVGSLDPARAQPTVRASPLHNDQVSLLLDSPACVLAAEGCGSASAEPSTPCLSTDDVAASKGIDASRPDTQGASSGSIDADTITSVAPTVLASFVLVDDPATVDVSTAHDTRASHDLHAPVPALAAEQPPGAAGGGSASCEPPTQPHDLHAPVPALAAEQPPDAAGGGSASCEPLTQPHTSRPGHFVAIRDLKPSIADGWVLIGQVVSRQPVRQWSNVRGSGQLLSFLIADKTGGTIKATIFNEGVPMFDSVVQNGAVCSFAGGKVKVPNRSFSSAAHELTLDHRAAIQALPHADCASFSVTSVGSTIAGLGALRANDVVTVIGIIIQVDPARSITTAKGKSSSKREFLLVDDSMSKVICAVWGSQAQADVDRHLGTAVLIERATINDYRGARSINIGVGASVHFAPALPEASRLVSWFSNGRNTGDFAFVVAP